jgi:hypothetical protein
LRCLTILAALFLLLGATARAECDLPRLKQVNSICDNAWDAKDYAKMAVYCRESAVLMGVCADEHDPNPGRERNVVLYNKSFAILQAAWGFWKLGQLETAFELAHSARSIAQDLYASKFTTGNLKSDVRIELANANKMLEAIKRGG